MCNIAGYVGTRPAAPILLEMMKREEGFAGGYNTGIATLSNGKIVYDKLVGDTNRLMSLTDAASFPGTIGICHSRSKSHSGKEWAHPFVSVENGDIVCAYIANGNPAKKSNPIAEANIAEALVNDGYDMLSRVFNNVSKAAYPQLSDGSKVHSSDVICQLAYKYMKQGFSAPEAIAEAFYDVPAERVGLMLTLTNPNAIALARVNMPVFVAFANHGAYIASTPLAFPDDAGEPQLLPANTSGWLYADSISLKPFVKINIEVPPMDAKLIKNGYDIVLKELESGPKTFTELLKPLGVLYGECECMTRAALAYTVLNSLKAENRINVDTVYAEPIFEGINVAKFAVSLK